MRNKIKNTIVKIPNFPKEGITFLDVTTILETPEVFKGAIDLLTEYVKSKKATKIIAPEARGFVFAVPVAYNLGLSFVPVRKPGKLPRETVKVEYELEYGTNTLEIHKDSIKKGDRVVIIDDLLATGGTVKAAANLVEKMEAEVVGTAFLIELEDLNGRKILEDKYEVYSVIKDNELMD